MDTKALRQKILDLAIHGKLVPQDPNDEPASVLLERINPKAEFYCDNKQYGDLPRGWCLVSGKYLYNPMKSAKPKGSTFKYIDIDSIDNTKQKIDRPKIIRTENAPSRASRYTQMGDIVFSMVRPYLKNIAIVPSDECIASTGFYICSPSDIAISKYCYYLMTSDYVVNGLNQFMKGDNSPSINKGDIDNWLFPLPPLAEQHRIVVEIERWLMLIDKVEQGKVALAGAIQQAKSKILDLAIHGKLVPQDPNDEPASALLKRINPNAQTTSDTPPYRKLPRGWAICKLEDIAEYEQPTAYIVNSTDYDDSYKTPVLTAGKSFIIGHTNEENGIYTNLPCIIFDDFTTDSKLVDFPFKVKSSAMKILQIKGEICIVEYVAMFMSITRLISDTHKRYWISEYSKIPIPVPPKEEQIRIVDSVRHLFAKLKDIANCL